MTAAAAEDDPGMTAARATAARVGAATAAAASPAPLVRRSPGRSAHLRLVPGVRGTAPRTPFVVVVVCLLGLGLLGLLGLNTVLAQDAFRLHTLNQEARALADREQALRQEVDGLTSPSALAERARALGMVPAGAPAFLRLPDGTVLGAPDAGAAVVTPEEAAAAASADSTVDTTDEPSDEPADPAPAPR